jgi:erythromycin esterase
MKKQHCIVVFAALFCLLHTARSQNDIEQYVHEHAFPIASINHDSTNYADLQVIGKAIGNARVVMPGEQEHGDAATFENQPLPICNIHS